MRAVAAVSDYPVAAPLSSWSLLGSRVAVHSLPYCAAQLQKVNCYLIMPISRLKSATGAQADRRANATRVQSVSSPGADRRRRRLELTCRGSCIVPSRHRRRLWCRGGRQWRLHPYTSGSAPRRCVADSGCRRPSHGRISRSISPFELYLVSAERGEQVLFYCAED